MNIFNKYCKVHTNFLLTHHLDIQGKTYLLTCYICQNSEKRKVLTEKKPKYWSGIDQKLKIIDC